MLYSHQNKYCFVEHRGRGVAPVDIPLMTMACCWFMCMPTDKMYCEIALPPVPDGATQLGSPVEIEHEAKPVLTPQIVAVGKYNIQYYNAPPYYSPMHIMLTRRTNLLVKLLLDQKELICLQIRTMLWKTLQGHHCMPSCIMVYQF